MADEESFVLRVREGADVGLGGDELGVGELERLDVGGEVDARDV
jgi:hypothetical protein